MIFFRVIRWIVWKDLLSEIRSRENISSMFFFALIIILIFSLSLSMDQEMAKEMIPGILWIAFSFTGIMAGKVFSGGDAERLHGKSTDGSDPKGLSILGNCWEFSLMLVVEIIIFPFSSSSSISTFLDRSYDYANMFPRHPGTGGHGDPSIGHDGSDQGTGGNVPLMLLPSLFR